MGLGTLGPDTGDEQSGRLSLPGGSVADATAAATCVAVTGESGPPRGRTDAGAGPVGASGSATNGGLAGAQLPVAIWRGRGGHEYQCVRGRDPCSTGSGPAAPRPGG